AVGGGRARVRAVLLLPRGPPARDRDRPARRLPRAAPRRVVGAIRATHARTPPYLGRARTRPDRPRADRERLRRREDAVDGGDLVRARRSVRVCALRAPRRARRRRTRPRLAARVGLLARLRLLGRRR